jgi:hypothetical protein
MTCEEFQNRLPELIESGTDAARHPHALACPICAALIEDLERIAEESRFRKFDDGS